MDGKSGPPKPDLTNIIRLNMKFLHFFGYFFPEFNQNVNKIIYLIYAVAFVGFAFFLSLLSQIAYMIDSFGDMEKMTEASFLLFTNIVQCFKLYCFMGSGQRVWKLIHRMNEKIFRPTNTKQCSLFLAEVKMSKIITKLFLLACTLTCMSWSISPLLDKRGVDNKRLPLSGWYPFHTDRTPAFELAYCYQIFSTWICGLGDISMDTFMSGTIMFISAQLSILNSALESIKLEYNTKRIQEPKLINQSLVRCVIHYENIIDFAEETMDLFSSGITGQFLVGVLVVCMSMFQMSLVSLLSFRFFAMMLYQTCVLMEMYLVCFYGNEVILKSDQLTQSAFMCDWIDASPEFKQSLIIFMSRTQIPLRLYASGYFTLSLETFKAISKSSWSYFAVLKQVHDQKLE